MKLETATRRAVLAVAGAHPNAAIFACGPRLRELWHRWDDALRAFSRISRGNLFKAVGPMPDPVTAGPGGQKAIGRWRRQRARLVKEHGVDAAEAATVRLGDEWADLAEQMLAISAKTIDGVRFKLAVGTNNFDAVDLLDAITADVINIGGAIAFWSDRTTEV